MEKQRLQVLIVGGQRILTETLMLLRIEGHDATLAADEATATRMAQESWPDVVLIDLDAPGLDGFAVAASIRALPAWISPMVITLTARPEEWSPHRFRQSAIDLALCRPLDRARLLHFLRRFQAILTFDAAV